MFFSVVIPTYNRLPILAKSLRALEKQKLAPHSSVKGLRSGAPGLATGLGANPARPEEEAAGESVAPSVRAGGDDPS